MSAGRVAALSSLALAYGIGPAHAFAPGQLLPRTPLAGPLLRLPPPGGLPGRARRGGAMATRASMGSRALPLLMSFCSVPFPEIPRWLVYQLQQALVGTVFVQLISVFCLCACMVVIGATILRLFVPKASKFPFSHWLVRSYVMLNKVTSNNPMVAETRREQILNNILFNCNILTISIITGLVAASAKTAIDRIVNGNLAIVEHGHTVLLMDQWNEQVVPIIQHFEKLANLPGGPSALRNRPVVILSNLPKARASALIEEGLSMTRGRKVKILVRQGDPRHAPDLAKVCVASADKVMLLTADVDRRNVVDGTPPKQLLTKVRQEASLLLESRKHVVARMEKGTPTAVMAVPGEGKHWTKFESDFSVCEDQEFVGRLLAMCTVESSSGLSQVYNTVLQPNRGNFYETDPVGQSPTFNFLVGKKFDDLQAHFQKCVVCGIVRGNELELSPKGDLEVQSGDSVLCFAHHHREVRASPQKTRFGDVVRTPHAEGEAKTTSHIPKNEWSKRLKRRILVLGWNERGQKTLEEISEVCPRGSMIVTLDSQKNDVTAVANGMQVSQSKGDYMTSEDLAKAGAMDSDCIVCLFDSSAASNTDDETDSQLLTVIHALGKLPKVPGKKLPRLVAMVHSASTLPLLQQAASEAGIISDFILSNELESGALVQVLMKPSLEKVFNTVLSATGSELLILPCTRYVGFNHEAGTSELITFQEIQTRARLNDQVAVGILQWRDMPEQHKLLLNPPQSKKLRLGEKDRIVVIGDFKDAYLDAPAPTPQMDAVSSAA